MLDVNAIVFGGEGFDVRQQTAKMYGGTGYATLEPRHKCYQATSILGFSFPLALRGDRWSRGHLYRVTQIEVAGGVGRTIRLGFNPGEFLDFILGWTTLDIFDDDLEWTKRQSNHELKATGRPAP